MKLYSCDFACGKAKLIEPGIEQVEVTMYRVVDTGELYPNLPSARKEHSRGEMMRLLDSLSVDWRTTADEIIESLADELIRHGYTIKKG